MSITIKLIGPMRKPQGKAEHILADTSIRIDEVLLSIGYQKKELPFFTIRKNDQIAQLNDQLSKDDIVTIFLPVGGG